MAAHGGREARHEQERELKIEAIKTTAIALFAKKGYQGTTIEDIAEATGYAKASLYYYFKNKEEIFSAIVSDTLDRLLADVAAMHLGATSAENPMKLVIDHFMREKFEKKGLFQVFHQLQTFFSEIRDAEVKESVIAKLIAVMNQINNIMKRGIDSGRVRRESPETLAGIFMGMLFGVVFFTGGPDVPPAGREAYSSLLESIILKGFSPSENKELP